MNIEIHIPAESSNEPRRIALIDSLAGINGLQTGPLTHDNEEFRSRITGLDVLVTFIGSAAFLQFAKALRDWVNRNRVKISLRDTVGSELIVDASGPDVEKIGDFLKDAYAKK